MYYLIYKTTNKIDGKQYIGCHITKDKNDSYLGSGKLLLKAIEKYGIENFERVILEECESSEAMFIAEAKHVSSEWVVREDTYNLKVGGEGGWDYVNTSGCRWNDVKREFHSAEMKKRRSLGQWGPQKPTCGFSGKTHSEESKGKISKNNHKRLSDEELQIRISQWNDIPNKRGKIKTISEKWGISHTQVRRFAKIYNLPFA